MAVLLCTTGENLVRELIRRSWWRVQLRLRGGAGPGCAAARALRKGRHLPLSKVQAHGARRYGLASLLSMVVLTLEELVVERCYDLITTAALRAMGGCRSLKVGACSWAADAQCCTSVLASVALNSGAA